MHLLSLFLLEHFLHDCKYTNEIHNLQALCRNCHGKKTILDKLN